MKIDQLKGLLKESKTANKNEWTYTCFGLKNQKPNTNVASSLIVS